MQGHTAGPQACWNRIPASMCRPSPAPSEGVAVHSRIAELIVVWALLRVVLHHKAQSVVCWPRLPAGQLLGRLPAFCKVLLLCTAPADRDRLQIEPWSDGRFISMQLLVAGARLQYTVQLSEAMTLVLHKREGAPCRLPAVACSSSIMHWSHDCLNYSCFVPGDAIQGNEQNDLSVRL